MLRQAVFRVGIAIAVTVGAVLPSALPAPPAHSDADVTIAVVGDSYTAGTAAGGRGPQSWPQTMGHLLAAHGMQIDADVQAEGGAGYAHIGERGATFQSLTARAVHDDDELVVFFGSVNDVPMDPLYPVTVARTFRLARTLAPDARFLVIGPVWPSADPPPELFEVRDNLRSEATMAGARFVDPVAAHWLAGHPELIGPDRIHPNDAGHVYLAKKIAPLVVRELIFGTM